MASKVTSQKETMDILLEISNILNTGLDAEALSICVNLIEAGVNPEALGLVVQELRQKTIALKENAPTAESSKFI